MSSIKTFAIPDCLNLYLVYVCVFVVCPRKQNTSGLGYMINIIRLARRAFDKFGTFPLDWPRAKDSRVCLFWRGYKSVAKLASCKLDVSSLSLVYYQFMRS